MSFAKSKGEKERYKHLNAEFQRIARRNKKAFLSDQCKETEGNNRMGKTRESATKKELLIYTTWIKPALRWVNEALCKE